MNAINISKYSRFASVPDADNSSNLQGDAANDGASIGCHSPTLGFLRSRAQQIGTAVCYIARNWQTGSSPSRRSGRKMDKLPQRDRRCESKLCVGQNPCNSLVAKCESAVSGALVGAICGMLLAAFGSAISSTPVGVVSSILIIVLLGVWLGGSRNVILCAVSAPLIVAMFAVMGGSVLGVASTIAVCGLFGGWRGWIEATGTEPSQNEAAQQRFRKRSETLPRSLPFRQAV